MNRRSWLSMFKPHRFAPFHNPVLCPFGASCTCAHDSPAKIQNVHDDGARKQEDKQTPMPSSTRSSLSVVAADEKSSLQSPARSQTTKTNFKLFLIGDGATGKTSFVERVATNTFREQYIGVCVLCLCVSVFVRVHECLNRNGCSNHGLRADQNTRV